MPRLTALRALARSSRPATVSIFGGAKPTTSNRSAARAKDSAIANA